MGKLCKVKVRHCKLHSVRYAKGGILTYYNKRNFYTLDLQRCSIGDVHIILLDMVFINSLFS